MALIYSNRNVTPVFCAVRTNRNTVKTTNWLDCSTVSMSSPQLAQIHYKFESVYLYLKFEFFKIEFISNLRKKSSCYELDISASLQKLIDFSWVVKLNYLMNIFIKNLQNSKVNLISHFSTLIINQ